MTSIGFITADYWQRLKSKYEYCENRKNLLRIKPGHETKNVPGVHSRGMLRTSSALVLCAIMVANVSAFLPCGPLRACEHRLTLSNAQRRQSRCNLSTFECQDDRRRSIDHGSSRVCIAAQLSDANQFGRRKLLQSLAFVAASSTLTLGSSLVVAEVMPSPCSCTSRKQDEE